MYVDQRGVFDKLPDEIAGKLIKHIFSYVNDENPTLSKDDLIIEIAFEPIKLQLKRDLKKWENTASKNAENGKLGGIKSGEARRQKAKQDEANEATASKSKRTQANEADTDTVTVNDTVNDNDNTSVKNEFLREREILNSVKDYFPIDIIKNLTDKDKENWCDTINKLNRIDGYDFETIQNVIIWGRKDSFWNENFSSVAALRKKRNGVMKFTQMLLKMEGKKNEANRTNKERTELARQIAEDIYNDPDLNSR